MITGAFHLARDEDKMLQLQYNFIEGIQVTLSCDYIVWHVITNITGITGYLLCNSQVFNV